mmetsp:Transcript_22893/g.27085  ORF Transcript_22893/g.27085 Transcript_22893/m.27085 type:complete len:231 (+) Transcript_22893:506-1198(+)
MLFIHQNIDVGLSGPRLHVIRIQIQRHFDLTHRSLNILNLTKRRAKIVPNRRILRRTFHRILVCLRCLLPLLRPKMRIPPLLRLLRPFLILIRVLNLQLLQFHRLHKPLRRRIVKFELRIFTHFDSVCEIALLLIGFGTTEEGLGSVFKRCAVLLPDFDRLVASGYAFVVLFRSKVHRRLVREEGHVGGIESDGFVICGDGFIEFFSFVEGVAPFLRLDGLLLLLSSFLL